MRLLRKWCYPLLLAAVGSIYLYASGDWTIYTEQIHKNSEEQNHCSAVEKPQEQEAVGDGCEIPDRQEDITIPEDESSVAVDNGSAAGPIFQTVDSTYFEDALFIGDSRTVALYKYGDLEKSVDFFASTGLNVYRLFKEKLPWPPEDKTKRTLEEMLAAEQYGKIYFMMGINEMGIGTQEEFVEKYEEIIRRIHELQPDAVIFVQAIMRVTTARSDQGDYITNEGIDERNQAIQALTDGETYIYLDVNSVLCDEDGGLCPDYSFDGVHLKAKYVDLWKSFLLEHGVVK